MLRTLTPCPTHNGRDRNTRSLPLAVLTFSEIFPAAVRLLSSEQ